MTRIRITGPAKADTRKILIDLHAKAGHRVAEKYAADFEDVLNRLIEFPQSGAPRTAMGPNTRIALVKPYIFIYDYNGNELALLRIVHGTQNITHELLSR